MRIPSACASWRSTLLSGTPRHVKVLRNFQQEGRLPADIRDAFFDRLATRIPVDSPDAAISVARDVVAEDAEYFTCKGTDVPTGCFEDLLVVERGSGLKFKLERLDPATLDVLRKKTGLRRNTPFADLKQATADYILELLAQYEPTPFSNRIGVVWATDLRAARALLESPPNRLRLLIDRLGLRGYDHERHVLLFAYRRDRLRVPLRAPTVLDADGYERFSPCRDPVCGRTRPVSVTARSSLPEAVHRETAVVPFLRESRLLP